MQTANPEATKGITCKSLRAYVKNKEIGCVGSLVRFRGNNKQVHAAHIQQSFFNQEDIDALNNSKSKQLVVNFYVIYFSFTMVIVEVQRSNFKVTFAN